MSKHTTNAIVIPPHHYIHLMDKNDHSYRLITGPLNLILESHEMVLTGEKPMPMIELR